MHFTSTVASSLLLAGGALATYGSGGMEMGASSAASTPSAAGAAPAASASAASGDQVQVQVVQVGGAGGALTFTPNDIQAPVGSMVQFQFNPMVCHCPKTLIDRCSHSIRTTPLSNRRLIIRVYQSTISCPTSLASSPASCLSWLRMPTSQPLPSRSTIPNQSGFTVHKPSTARKEWLVPSMRKSCFV